MTAAVITGSGGLVGSEAAVHFAGLGLDVVGIDNDMRRVFFGESASTAANVRRLEAELGPRYRHMDLDVRDRDAVDAVFAGLGGSVHLVIHAAAQPSHDWSGADPVPDFDINAVGTLNLLEATRRHAPEACFIFTSTNKVYGDAVNRLPFIELETRWELDRSHPLWQGVPETMSVDASLHSPFGASKLGADVMVQEYGRYFGLHTVCFRGGTLTGPRHAATELHGFLAYVMRCAMTATPYRVYGYGGKQVRDAIHSSDLVRAFEAFYRSPRVAAVYNIGGGRFSNASVLEAIARCEEISASQMAWTYDSTPRIGDHIWWVSDNRAFEADYPEWRLKYDVDAILRQIHEENRGRWTRAHSSSTA